MSRPKLPISQVTQISNSDLYTDNLSSSAGMETDSVSLQDDLNAIRSQLKSILGESHWYSSPEATIAELANGGGGGGLTESRHKTLDQLVHNIAENCYIQLVRSSNKISEINIWSSSSMSLKIRDFIIYRTNGRVSEVTTNQYDENGEIVETLSQSIERINGVVNSITYTSS